MAMYVVVAPEAGEFGAFEDQLTDDRGQMTAIAAMDTGTSVFFDHRDPDQVGRLGTARLDI
jgi:2,5-diketo-D-gluconate reductase A